MYTKQQRTWTTYKIRTGSLFNELLMPALNTTFAFSHMDDMGRSVSEYLIFVGTKTENALCKSVPVLQYGARNECISLEKHPHRET